MSIKIDKSAYEKLIKEDLDFLNKHCPNSLELDHIKLIVCSSIDWHYPEKTKSMCLKDKQRNATCATNAMYMFLIRVINDVKQDRNEKKD